MLTTKKRAKFECKLCGKQTYILVDKKGTLPDRGTRDRRRYDRRRCGPCFSVEWKGMLVTRQTIKRIIEEFFYNKNLSQNDVAIMVRRTGYCGTGPLVGLYIIQIWTGYKYAIDFDTLAMLKITLEAIGEGYKVKILVTNFSYDSGKHLTHIAMKLEICR